MGATAAAVTWADASNVLHAIEGAARSPSPRSSEVPCSPDSAVRLKAVHAGNDAVEADDDELTLTLFPADSALPTLASAIGADREGEYAKIRLDALRAWLLVEDPTGDAVRFVGAFLGKSGALNRAIDGLAAAVNALAPTPLRAEAESFARATLAWWGSLVDYIDDLALVDHRSLDGWSSLREYSSIYLLAYVVPALTATDNWAIAGAEVCLVREQVQSVEGAIVDLSRLLRHGSD